MVAALEAEEGEREMDALLGASEKASEGFLQPQVPRWKQFLFWLFGVFFALVIRGFFKASADNRGRQRWLEEDPRLGLSRGVYDVQG